MGTVSAILRQGGSVGSASITVTWSATDDATAPENLVYEVEHRRLKGGSWTAWGSTQSVSGVTSMPQVALWRTHQYRVRAQDSLGNWSEWAESNTIRPLRRNERHFTTTGTWQSQSHPDAMRGRVLHSTTAGAEATLRFTGNGIALVMGGGPGFGIFNVCLDKGTAGEVCSEVDLSGFEPFGLKRFVHAYTGLASGLHTVTVTVVDGWIDLDGAIVSR
jgi:hypothetical protein